MIRNKSKIKGDNNLTTQVTTQNNYYQTVLNPEVEYLPDEKAILILKSTIEDENSPYIFYTLSLDGRKIQCGHGKLIIQSSDVGEMEMTYWEDSLNMLCQYGYIGMENNKGDLYKILKKGYDYYKNHLIDNKEANFNFGLRQIRILKLFRKNDYCLWDSDLKPLFDEDIDNEIEFNELISEGFIEEGNITVPSKGSSYLINPSKKIEILKALKNIKD